MEGRSVPPLLKRSKAMAMPLGMTNPPSPPPSPEVGTAPKFKDHPAPGMAVAEERNTSALNVASNP